MKRTCANLLVACLVLALTAPTLAGEPRTGAAVAHPIGASGVQGTFSLLDSGDAATGLVVAGSATGLDPAQGYLTLIYDSGSLPGGPGACVPTGGLTGAQMLVGFWNVEPDGTGTLFVIKEGTSYAPIGEIGAISIRSADFALQACGRGHGTP